MTRAGAAAALLPDGKRLHLHHGPIDIVAGVSGGRDMREAAFAQGFNRFRTILEELVAELPLLRASVAPDRPPAGTVARRMHAACLPHLPVFVTPMAAVAGAVAEEVLAAMLRGLPVARAFANNGGDIAFHLCVGATFTAAIRERGDAGRVTIRAGDPVRGIATSGWRGRSHSLGIADAVTVLAATAAEADAAATLIANAVDLPGHPAVRRTPARELAPDSDLGQRLVTTVVGRLDAAEVAHALDAGVAAAEAMRGRGLIHAAALFLHGAVRIAGSLAAELQGEPAHA